MPRTTTKPKRPKAKPKPPAPAAVPAGEVLTLAEAAAYLRLPEAEVVRLVREQGLPGRPAGAEWRFLKAAIQDWLKGPPAVMSNKEAWMSVAGIWKDDPTVDEMLKEIYRQRGRPMTEDGE
jgi:excisionase family DNA binding protein